MTFRHLLAVVILLLSLTGQSLHAQIPAAITPAIDQDPAPDKAHPAAFETFQLPSHGAQLNALMYIAAGAGPHPTVLLLHGFPGNEKNLDLAQTLRRAGYNVLFFNYRGSWGSPGDFSFTHSIEDVSSALAYLRDPANATKLRVDPTHLILIGHSMGGFMARYVGAHDPDIKAVGLISAADMAVDRIEQLKSEHPVLPESAHKTIIDRVATHFAEEGMAPLAGCTPQSLAEESFTNADAWNVPKLAPSYAGKSLLVLTSDDGLAPSNAAFVAALPKDAHVTTKHFATDHSYSDQRIALETAILNWLATL